MDPPGHAEQLQLALPGSDDTDIQQNRTIPLLRRANHRGEEFRADRIIDPPGFFGTRDYQRTRVIGVAEHTGSPWEGEVLQPRHQPVKSKGAGVKPPCKFRHVPVDGEHIRISR